MSIRVVIYTYIYNDIHANINTEIEIFRQCSSSIDAKTRANTITDTASLNMNIHTSANVNVCTNTTYHHVVWNLPTTRNTGTSTHIALLLLCIQRHTNRLTNKNTNTYESV